MKRALTIALALALVCGIAVMAAHAGPGCCKSKMDGKGAQVSAMTACTMGEFPHLTMKVADKSYDCPQAAEKAAEAAHAKVRFAVASDEFDCKEKAMTALADESERFTRRFTAIAAVVDGKMIFCKEELGGCGSAATASAGGSSCSKGKAELASAGEGKSCSAAKKAELAGAGEGKSCSSKKAAMAKAEGASCSKSKAAMASAEGGKSCAKSCGSGAIACVSKEEFNKAAQSKGAKFMVVGRTFDSLDEAVKARETALAAVKSVKMTYLVEGKEVGCSSQVCPMAKKAGKVEYVVGTEKTPCEIMGRINYAKAQYDAAKKAADQKLAKI